MIYLNETDILNVGVDWRALIPTIEKSVAGLRENDYSQPLKVYLRFHEPVNRIIAMPAYLGGEFNISGVKWIASFPNNIVNKVPRAHSVVILNETQSGIPVAILNTGLLSVIRTCAVSGFFLKMVTNARKFASINLGIIGFGPIGQYHLKMCSAFFGDRIARVRIYDVRKLDAGHVDFDPCKVVLSESWESVYEESDVLITATVASTPYIGLCPRAGSVHLNISLRDYSADVHPYFKDSIIVDDWDEVCREKTTIELMAREKGLKKEHTVSLKDSTLADFLARVPVAAPIMFNPMGMAVFDMAIASHYMKKSVENGVGQLLT